ncbi:MAG: hypothetical protein P1U56_24415 [Saprospiraceae bacterium]|nr:hypothetical protein [Saprospiraceae bacterium]
MYKSSPLTSFFKYAYPAIMIGGGSFAIYKMMTAGDPAVYNFGLAFSVVLIGFSFFLLQLPFKLKSIEATKKGVYIVEEDSKELIKYRDIQYVSKFDFPAPWFPSMKYYDRKGDVMKKIAIMPDAEHQTPFKEDEMSKYIKENMKLNIPDYDPSRHPDALRNMIKLLLYASPFIALVMYFLTRTPG